MKGWKAVAALVSCAAITGQGASLTVGAIGDSFTDEWSLLDPEGTTAGVLGWVEILEESDCIDFGQLTDFSGYPNDPRGLTGSGWSYTWNFALRGSTTTSCLGSGSPNYLVYPYWLHPYSQVGSPTQPGTWGGFRAAAIAGDIDYGVIAIGINDILIGSFNYNYTSPGVLAAAVADPILNPTGYAVLQDAFTQIWEGYDVATGGTSNAVRMVVATVTDLGTMPYMQRTWDPGWTFTPQELANIRANTQILNGWIVAEATVRSVPVLDLWSWWDDARTNGLVLADFIIDVTTPAPSTTDLTRLGHFWLDDGIHPTPIAHALLANQVLTILRDDYGETIDPFTEEQLLWISGLHPVAIESVTPDPVTGFVTVRWPKVPGRDPTVEWTDGLPGVWDPVDGPALADIVDGGNGRWEWTDSGADPDMGGVPPSEVDHQRHYRVVLD